jgi:hypothetical protein
MDLLLEQMPDVPDGKTLTLSDGRAATVAGPYHAASGRVCRKVTFRVGGTPADRRLACSAGDGDWAWFPVVVP